MRLQGWEEFEEGRPDRVIGAFEHFGHDRCDDFFATAYRALPDDGAMLLHTITALTQADSMRELGMPLTFTVARFVKFILTEIFPGGRLPTVSNWSVNARRASRFPSDPGTVLQAPLRADTRLVGGGVGGASAEGDRRAVAGGLRPLHHYLTGCAHGFRVGYIDVNQFTLQK